jgi:colicin import membrane protein
MMPTRDEPLAALKQRIAKLQAFVTEHDSKVADLQAAIDLLDAKQVRAQAQRSAAEQGALSTLEAIERMIVGRETRIADLRKAIRQDRAEHDERTKALAELRQAHQAAAEQESHVRGAAQRQLKESGWGEYRRKQAHLERLERRLSGRQAAVAERKAKRDAERRKAAQEQDAARQKAAQELTAKRLEEARRILRAAGELPEAIDVVAAS